MNEVDRLRGWPPAEETFASLAEALDRGTWLREARSTALAQLGKRLLTEEGQSALAAVDSDAKGVSSLVDLCMALAGMPQFMQGEPRPADLGTPVVWTATKRAALLIDMGLVISDRKRSQTNAAQILSRRAPWASKHTWGALKKEFTRSNTEQARSHLLEEIRFHTTAIERMGVEKWRESWLMYLFD